MGAWRQNFKKHSLITQSFKVDSNWVHFFVSRGVFLQNVVYVVRIAECPYNNHSLIETMSLVVNKFGGGIMKSSSAIKHLSEIVKHYDAEDQSLNVFSAFGKTTNNLEKILNSWASGDSVESNTALDGLRAFHTEIARELFPEDHVVFDMIEDVFNKIQRSISSIGQDENIQYKYDQIIPFGEILATLTVSEYFSYVGISNKLVHATDFLETDSNFNTANVDREATYKNLKVHMAKEILSRHKNIITEGFIGFSEKGMTTLGREGSDYTAGILGNMMDADRVVLWKDVPGVMDKDPRLVGSENVQKIDSINYGDFEKHLQSNAVGLVHPKTLNEVKEKRIPLYIRPFWDLSSEGTVIM